MLPLLDWIPRKDGIWLHHMLLYAALKHRKIDLMLNPMSEFLMLKEWGMWEDFYVPPEGLKGKTVLDAGAGCGESAWFFLSHGARRVIAVESDYDNFQWLQTNVRNHGWPVECINERFALKHLDGVDMAKIDVEGGESVLLELERLPHGCIEVHGPMKRAFCDRWPNLSFKKVGRKVWIAKT